MTEKEHYAVWYSTSTDYASIRNQYVYEKEYCQFEQDFHLQNELIDYDHAVIIWYGKELGALGKVSREENDALDSSWDFITQPVSEKLKKLGVNEITYLFALPDFKYRGKTKSTELISFLGNIECQQEIDKWMTEIRGINEP